MAGGTYRIGIGEGKSNFTRLRSCSAFAKISGVWPFGNQNHQIIEVRCCDRASGKVFHQIKLPIGKLPESFEASTTMHLGNEDWHVVEARPMTAAEFRHTGKLTLIMAKIEKGVFDASTVLFSMPTITNDALPSVAAGSSKLGASVLEIHEDDWRQIEWLPTAVESTIDAELTPIRSILQDGRHGPGFKECHLRKGVPTLRSAGGDVTMDELRSAIDPRGTWLMGFAIGGVAGIVDRSFAVKLFSSIEMFGTASERGVETICFANTRANNAARAEIAGLAGFAASRGLILVDWCRASAVMPEEGAYLQYFGVEN